MQEDSSNGLSSLGRLNASEGQSPRIDASDPEINEKCGDSRYL